MMLLEFFVEEQSAEAALINLIPIILAEHEFEYEIYTFQGKADLLRKLPKRLSAYKHWIDDNHCIIVLVDRDDEDCHQLKHKLEVIASEVGLVTRSASPNQLHIVNRIAIEELEAWFFGDVAAMKKAYPRISQTLDKKAAYRDPDAISGGTWERLEKLLIDYHPGGLEKIRAAEEISRHMAPDNNCSKSFQVFRDSLKRIFA